MLGGSKGAAAAPGCSNAQEFSIIEAAELSKKIEEDDNAPKPVLERVSKERADAAREKLEAAGAGVEVK